MEESFKELSKQFLNLGNVGKEYHYAENYSNYAQFSQLSLDLALVTKSAIQVDLERFEPKHDHYKHKVVRESVCIQEDKQDFWQIIILDELWVPTLQEPYIAGNAEHESQDGFNGPADQQALVEPLEVVSILNIGDDRHNQVEEVR